MLFEWDERKREANLAKRLIDFEDVRMVSTGRFSRESTAATVKTAYANHLRGADEGKTDFKRLREMRDEDIDYSDIPKLDESFRRTAKLGMPAPQDRVTIRGEHDGVEWLKKNGSGDQTRINAILRCCMNAQSGASR